MGGFYYETKQGDMWDYIAWKVYGDERYCRILWEAAENKQYLKVYLFSAGIRIWCPYVEEDSEGDEIPAWRDSE